MTTLDRRLRELERQNLRSPIVEDEDFRVLMMSGLSHEQALDELEANVGADRTLCVRFVAANHDGN